MAPPKGSSSQDFYRGLIMYFMQHILAYSFIGAVFYIGVIKYPTLITSSMPHLHSLMDRILFTLRCQLFSLTIFLLGILVVIFERFTGAYNPLNASTEQSILVYKQCLQNTLEQLILNASIQVILCTYLNEDEMKIVPLLVFFFVLGRIAFWIGYIISPYFRAFGFIISFIPHILALGYCFYCTMTFGIGYQLENDLYKASNNVKSQ